ncbi:1-acyl-sn-glycerol-3-phosphate acyltransferase epsilon isoform X2 [Stegostoma tigrinum]|uniref:1-acyl-sn-glycerol-3-phosphate acyltransferase epsilon isoform X2 n=1 Tax=Stegostoma tigrinum TaxID=3053191 RepID=UPI002870A1F2|nr:1-acyl-sn-glycerol-3-phosphate acyltransferase epsilon isoform X2 [Stegostoma tigrinum]
MLLSLVVHTHSLRYWLPAAVMMGTAPVYLLTWAAWRLLSMLLPARLYHIMDDRLYTIYQSVVLFFFESYTGVEHGGIYVKRSAKFNEKAMADKLEQQIKVGTPAYLVIFPEGTRYNPDNPEVIAASQAYAHKEGLPALKHAMSPRVKATRVAVNTMRGHLDAVYDVTVAYEGTINNTGYRATAPSMPEFLCRECPRIHIFFERVDVKEVPEEAIFLKRWLHERFEIKDKLLTEFYESEDEQKRYKFPGEGHKSQLSLMRTLPSLLFLGGLTVPMLLTESGRKIYMKTWIYGTLVGWLWVNIRP